MNYNMAASRELVAALGVMFEADKFDEYTILSHARELPVDFLHDRNRRERVCFAHWLRWAAYRKIGVVRDPDNSTWFRVLPGYRTIVGGAEPNRTKTKIKK